jgi:ubiquinone/menaquinone biosynthesis C-methylase UbiE
MILYLLIILLLLYVVFTYYRKEGFDNMTEYKTYMNENIYNAFYTRIYDELIHTIHYETEVIQSMAPLFGSNPNILCVGSRTGHIVQLLSETAEVTGLDNSKAMVEMAKHKYPKNKYIYGEYTDKNIFQENTYTHIICPLFTIYRVDIDKFLDVMYRWMVHKGVIAIVYFKNGFHISQIQNQSPSKSFELNYKYTIEYKGNTITEKITNKKNESRINKLELKDISNLEQSAKETGFKIMNTTEIPNMPYTYMLLLQKN